VAAAGHLVDAGEERRIEVDRTPEGLATGADLLGQGVELVVGVGAAQAVVDRRDAVDALS